MTNETSHAEAFEAARHEDLRNGLAKVIYYSSPDGAFPNRHEPGYTHPEHVADAVLQSDFVIPKYLVRDLLKYAEDASGNLGEYPTVVEAAYRDMADEIAAVLRGGRNLE